MTPPDGAVATKPTVADEPISFAADISDGPAAASSENHLYGSASGDSATYPDLRAFAWWYPEEV